MEYVAVRGKRPPTHPGVVLRETVLPHLGLKVTEVAVLLGVTRQTLHRILAENSSVSPEMALRLGKFCGNGEQVWMNMQAAYDLWYARQKIGKEVEKIKTMATEIA